MAEKGGMASGSVKGLRLVTNTINAAGAALLEQGEALERSQISQRSRRRHFVVPMTTCGSCGISARGETT